MLYGFITRPESSVLPLDSVDMGYPNFLDRAVDESSLSGGVGAFSCYDALFREICLMYGHNWLLLSAIAHVESHYNHEAISNVGARGLMQIMPSTAAIYGVDKSQLTDPRVSIDLANRYLLEIERMLALPEGINYHDQLSLTLAAYNGGIGRVYDAQRLARSAGNDPNRWDELKWHMLSLRKEDVYTRPEVRYGRFKGSGATLAYVRNVMNVYDDYCIKAENSPYHLLPAARGE
ncbi:MAG: transglycosylase SLT domain-containing protein [Rikenellaceae bacterium]